MLHTSVFFRLLAALSVILLLGLGVPLLLPADILWPNIPFHSAVESIGAVIACAVGLLILFSWQFDHSRYPQIWTAAALLGMGLLDSLHAMVAPGNTFVWLHSIATFTGGLYFALNWLPRRAWLARRRGALVAGLLLLALLPGLPALWLEGWPLSMVREGTFTGAARGINIAGGLLFVIAGLHFIRGYQRHGQAEDALFAILCILFGTAGLAFEMSALWNPAWWWWHLLRLGAYLAVLIFMLQLFRNNELERFRSEQNYRAVVDSATEAIITCTRDGTITSFNPMAEAIFGYCRDEAVGSNIAILMPESFRQDHRHYLQRFQEGQVQHVLDKPRELWGRRKNGKTFPIQLLLSQSTIDGELQFTGFIRDLSEWKETANQLSRTHGELEEANRDLASISYSLSHDLKTPLRAIDGFSQILHEEYHDRLDTAGRSYLNRVRSASQHMGQLVDDAQQYLHITQNPLNCRPLDMSDLARHILEELQQARPKQAADIHIQDGMTAQADPRMARELLYQLLSNAWKYTPHEQASIEMGTLPANQLTYYIRDNGIGFDMQYSGKIFQVFQRLHRHGEYSGSGIGLAIANRIIQRHGGKLWAEAEPDRGATFYFTLRHDNDNPLPQDQPQQGVAS